MYGIKHTELEWFSFSLDKRKQAVFCHNKLSSWVDIITGVPQGSVLGPFLFLLFINDISNSTTDGCVTNLFADDAMIYASGDSVSEVQRKLQSCLSNISSWYRENRLKINSDKSKVMHVGSKAQLKSLNVDEFILNYKGMPLESVENAKYLSMTINSDILGFSCATAFSKYVLPSVFIKAITSHIPQGSSFTSLEKLCSTSSGLWYYLVCM